jgi:signal transduction histidine kinase
MKALIHDLLAYSRAGTNGKVLREISSEDALKEALTNLRATIEESGTVATHDSLPAITTDHTQLAQIFQNLVGNAIKYRRPVPHVHSLPRTTAARNGSFPCETTVWESIHSALKGSSSFSSGCTGEESLKAGESDWPFARRC